MRVRRLAPLAGALLALGCSSDAEPRAQWVVRVGTDAPLPQFGDQLLVEVVDASGNLACEGCSRLVGLSATTKWPVSFGVTPPPGAGELHVRARLYRGTVTDIEGRPFGTTLLDAVGRLPAADGVTRVSLALEMACFGVPADPVAHTSCDPATGTPGPEPTLMGGIALPEPGYFSMHAVCAGTPPPDMVCIPGDAFLLGDVRVDFFGGVPAHPERLVKVSPFYMDVDEFTVGSMRQLVNDGQVTTAPSTPTPIGQPLDACTWLGASDGANDALPVTCVNRAAAQAACAALGKRLPTEAEWEYAASNGTAENAYPWGDEPATCDSAIAARGTSAGEGFVEPLTSTACRLDANGKILPRGPTAGGSPLDVNVFGVKNLGGNVTEWVADAYEEYTAPCWSDGPVMLVDPKCEGSDAARASVRGGSWSYPLFFTRAPARQPVNKAGAGGHSLGFRCVRSASE